MAKTYFNETSVFGKDYTLANFRFKKFRDMYLITSDHGAWALLKKKEIEALNKNTLKESLFKTLEDKGIIYTNHNQHIIEELFKGRYHFLNLGTTLHIIIPTLRCNLKCIYCHSSVKPSNDHSYDMTRKTAKKTLEFIFQTPAKSITIEFQGGDAMLHLSLFQYIIKLSKEMNKIHKKKNEFCIGD